MSTFDPHPHVVAALGDIAPDVDPADTDADLHDELGLDSMDLLNLATAVGTSTGIEIPDRDLGRLRTISQLEAYLSEHAAPDPP